ncbi:MAG: sigma-54-dependent Fis family transcriptional regulator [Acidobacteria bacterium]|nr:sigma-54-dependent Fis family transcriptional regulator [Acidobacteriota bacterium]
MPNKNTRILLVDDDTTFRRVMDTELTRRGYKVVAVASGAEALEQAPRANADVTLLDLRLPDMDGIEVLKRLQERNTPSAVVVLTAHGTIDTAIQAIRLGAHDYLEKPCPIAKLEMAIQKTCEHERLVKRQRVLEDGYAAPNVAPGLVGASPAFVKLMDNVARIARAGATTLVLGETGVGKEVVAALLHAQSPRGDAPFVVVDCASLHEELLQSEIFGHERGAFTGANRLKHGLFEVASGGTIFLDEVGDISPDVQAKLLRVLETGRFRRLGGTDEISVDVRIIAATNRDLRSAISRGHFREDLFYRLATFVVEIPPLRERPEDIRLLVEHYAAQLNQRFSLDKRVGPEAMDALLRHSWPGNVRELIHVLEQAVVLSDDDEIGREDLPPPIRGVRAEAAAPPEEGREEGREEENLTLREVQRRHVFRVLEKAAGNRAQAARLLGTSERTFYRLLERYRGASNPPPRAKVPSSSPKRES